MNLAFIAFQSDLNCIFIQFIYHMQLGDSGIVVFIFLIFLKMSFLELGHFKNTLRNCKTIQHLHHVMPSLKLGSLPLVCLR